MSFLPEEDLVTLANRSPEQIAATLRRAGVSVTEPRADNLAEELAETLRRVQAGEALDELSRRDPEALCALAQTRALDAHEARMLLCRVRYLEALLDAGARERDGMRSWLRHQTDNATLWGRLCGELGRVIGRVAAAARAPHLEEDHEALVEAVSRQSHAAHSVPTPEPDPPPWPCPNCSVPCNCDCPCHGPSPVAITATPDIFVRAGNELTELREIARKVAAFVGQPGLEQDPARLGALLVEQVLAGDVVRGEGAGDTEDCNCGGVCSRKGERMVCGQCGRSWRAVRGGQP
jgi:hypothetical protein